MDWDRDRDRIGIVLGLGQGRNRDWDRGWDSLNHICSHDGNEIIEGYHPSEL